MHKNLNIDLYLEGYNTNEVSCLDLPVAGATGFYNYENYFYYCFYYSIFNNWVVRDSRNWLQQTNMILKKLGFCLKVYQIKDSSQFIPFIKSMIDNSIPIVLIADYTSLFYTPEYWRNINTEHGVIISGYDSDKSLVFLRETKVVDRITFSEIDKYIKADPLYWMQLPESILLEIWNKRNEHFLKSNRHFVNVIYGVEKTNDSNINNYHDIITDFIYNFNLEKDNLADLINNYDSIMRHLKDETLPQWVVRRDYQYSLNAFFKGFEESFRSLNNIDLNLDNYYRQKNDYIESRKKIISFLYANALRGKKLDGAKSKAMINEITNLNRQLYQTLKGLYSIYIKTNSEESQLFNYALGTKSIADSEYQNDFIHCKASQAVDGKWDFWETEAWVSANINSLHWLKIDLVKPRMINNFRIRHFNHEIIYTTVSYEIQGSNDDVNWDVLVTIPDNKDRITDHEIALCSYRYFKLVITNPGQFDFCARIKEFEIRGPRTDE